MNQEANEQTAKRSAASDGLAAVAIIILAVGLIALVVTSLI